MSKERTTTYANSAYISGPEGEKYIYKSAVHKIGGEDDYIKIYHNGMHYLSDIPSDCLELLTILLPYMTYAENPNSPTYRYSMTIIISADLKKRIAKQMNYKSVNAISNLLTELTDGGILKRLARSIYRVNPFIFGRGEYRDIVLVRELDEFAFRCDNTFAQECKRNKEMRKHKRKLDKTCKPSDDPIIDIIE